MNTLKLGISWNNGAQGFIDLVEDVTIVGHITFWFDNSSKADLATLVTHKGPEAWTAYPEALERAKRIVNSYNDSLVD